MVRSETWLDFETWLGINYNKNVSDLSWNAYVKLSKEYNTVRLSIQKYEIETEKGIAND